MTAPRLVVAIPVRNEEAHIVACIAALAAQVEAGPDAIVLLLNNCTDGTACAVASMAARHAGLLRIVERDLAPGEANAGHARGLAMDAAAELAGPRGVVLTTDADGIVATDWIAATLRAFRGGADAVAGRAVIDPLDALEIPRRLHEDDAREQAYAAAIDEISSLLDPDPADPWPRHMEDSGASIAVTVAAFRAVGGLPRVRLGEDRAFVAALRRHDARVRHAPDVVVTVSGRIQGRAEGGMADTIRRRLSARDAFLDDRLEPAAHAASRARLRHRLRAIRRAGCPRHAVERAAQTIGVDPDQLGRWLDHPHFGGTWAEIEAGTPALRRRPVPVTDLARQMAATRRILAALRLSDLVTAEPGRSGSAALAAS